MANKQVKVQHIIQKIEELPPMPDVVVRLLEASRDPQGSMREMVELIRLDPALTGKVLKLCNSSYYGLPRQINTLNEALVYIGTDTLVNFILAGCLSSYYKQAQTGYGLERGELWRHSVGCAIASQRISQVENDPATKNLAFTAGLLHDIGKIVLDEFVGEAKDEIDNVASMRDLSFEEAEKEVLGFSQTEIGYTLAKHWNLPQALLEAIRFHQHPENTVEFPALVSQVHIGNVLSISFGIGLGNDGHAYTFHPYALNATGIRIASLFDLSLEIHEQFRRAEELLSLAR